MGRLPSVIQRLIAQFTRLPGVGPKTAERYIDALLKMPKAELSAFSTSITELGKRIAACEICFDFAEKTPCSICADPNRSAAHLCIVAESADLRALERSGVFAGKYHVLGGLLRPTAGVTPDRLTLSALERRIKKDGVREIILALDPIMEGEATTQYLMQRLAPLGVRMTRLARGLPMGADIAYADDLTLENAFAHREDIRLNGTATKN